VPAGPVRPGSYAGWELLWRAGWVRADSRWSATEAMSLSAPLSRGYAHSRWGREYRLTDSQVAAIHEDLARPPRPAPGPRPVQRAEPACKQAASSRRPAEAARAPAPRRRPAPAQTDVRQALAEQLASPLAVAATENPPGLNCRDA
jgi:hypothetical protein